MKIPLLTRKDNPKSVDPVCHMDVDPSNPPGGRWEHKGVIFNFCGPGCNRAFQKTPDAYLSGDKKLDMGR